MDKDTLIAALQAERAGLVDRGLDDRVAQVDAEIAHLGGENVADVPAGDEKPLTAAEKKAAAKAKAEEEKAFAALSEADQTLLATLTDDERAELAAYVAATSA